MADFRTASEALTALLRKTSDRIAGRPFVGGSPQFYGIPDAPDERFALLGEEDGVEDPYDPATAVSADQAAGSPVADTAGGSARQYTTGSLAWGGHQNGRIPASEMTALEKQSNHRLEATAAAKWNKMIADAAKAGIDISITDSYRSYQAQVDVRRRKGHLVATATPGTSNHGWGRATDINVNDPKVLAWLQANAGKYGWVNPDWAKRAGKSYEPWHWEFREAGDGESQPHHHGDGHDHDADRPQRVQTIRFDTPGSDIAVADIPGLGAPI